MKMPPLFFCFLIFSTASLLADVKDVLEDNYKAIELKTDEKTRCIYMDVNVNEVDGMLILDNRSPRTILALENLEKFKLTKGDSAGNDRLPNGETTSMYQVAAEKLNLGGSLMFNMSLLAASAQHGNGVPDMGEDGKLGGDVFGAVQCIFHYPEKKFYWADKDAELDTSFADAMEQLDVMAMELGENGADADMVVKINGTDAHFLVDTAASESLLAKEHLKDMGLTVPKLPEGVSLPVLGHIEEMKLGSVTLKNLPLRVVSLSAQKLDSPARKIAGIIGSDLLSETGAVLDYTNKKIYFPDIEVDGSEFSIYPGGFPFKPAVTKRLLASSEAVFAGTLIDTKNLAKVIKVGDEEYLVFGIAFTETGKIKGQSKETQVVKVRFKRSLGNTGAEELLKAKFDQSNDGWIVFKNRRAVLELDQTVFRDGARRREELEKK